MLVVCVQGTPLNFRIPKSCIELARATRDLPLPTFLERSGDRARLWQPEYFLYTLLLIVTDYVYIARGRSNRVFRWIFILFLAICNCHLRYCMCFTFLPVSYALENNLLCANQKRQGNPEGEEWSEGTHVPANGYPEKQCEKKPKGNTLGPCHGGFGLKFWSIIVGHVP